MSCNADLAEPTALHQRAIRTLEKQQKVLAARLRPQRDPRPGDGVCPTHEQYHEVTTRSRESWQALLVHAKRNSEPIDMVIQLMELLKNVPAFPKAALSEQLSTLNSYALMVECASEWVTTNDPECDRPVKIMRHYQILGIPRPVSYHLSDIQPTVQSTEDKHFLPLIFAWSYILSAHWVEALKSSGLDAQLLHDDISTQNFWEFIQKQQWRAVVLHDDVLYFSPWSLLRSGERLKYARKTPLRSPSVSSCANSSNSDHPIPASSTTQSALQMLADVCTTEELFQQSIIALAVVMMLPSRAYKKTVLLPQRSPSIDLKGGATATGKSTFDELSSNLDKCITLSCSPEGIDSLLCSVFFDPAVSCNLIGGQMTGTMEALLPLHEGGKTFLRVISKQFPKLVPLWAAAICIHEAESIFGKCAGGTPPLDLPVASWTGVVESFVQVHYSSDGLAADELLRAEEWRNMYLITAERLPPFSPSPPFGKTDESNLNIDIRKHLRHDHQLLSYRMYWILKTGEKVPAHLSYTSMPTIDAAIEATCPRSLTVDNRYAVNDRTRHLGTNVCSPIDNTEDASCNATFNTFFWFQNVEEGLWLSSGSESSSDVREVMHHRWITEGEEEDDVDNPEDDNDKVDYDLNHLEEWLSAIEDEDLDGNLDDLETLPSMFR